jgi:ABC-type polysaccharide/polyol phosphate transport system ATPase subunit
MRLDKLTIGSAKNSPTHQFKNLKDVTIDFDQDNWVTVVIGWNGTGKSNVLEALAIIFRELISQKKPTVGFAFRLVYRMAIALDVFLSITILTGLKSCSVFTWRHLLKRSKTPRLVNH